MTTENNNDKLSLEWRAVVGFEGIYEVSSLGDIRSLDRSFVNALGHHVHLKGRPLAPRFRNIRYGMMIFCRDGITKKNRTIHTVVAEAFLGPRPDGMVVNHIDGNKHNNSVENLEYVTQSQNVRHAFDNNLRVPKRGSDHYSSNLTEADIVVIRNEFSSGIRGVDLARRYSTTNKAISNICRRKTWKHVA